MSHRVGWPASLMTFLPSGQLPVLRPYAGSYTPSGWNSRTAGRAASPRRWRPRTGPTGRDTSIRAARARQGLPQRAVATRDDPRPLAVPRGPVGPDLPPATPAHRDGPPPPPPGGWFFGRLSPHASPNDRPPPPGGARLSPRC